MCVLAHKSYTDSGLSSNEIQKLWRICITMYFPHTHTAISVCVCVLASGVWCVRASAYVCACAIFRNDVMIIDLKKSMVDFRLKIQKRLYASLIYNLFGVTTIPFLLNCLTNFWSRQSYYTLRYARCLSEWVSHELGGFCVYLFLMHTHTYTHTLPLSVDMRARMCVCACVQVWYYLYVKFSIVSMPTPLKYLEILLEEKKNHNNQTTKRRRRRKEITQSVNNQYGNMCTNWEPITLPYII